MNADKADFSFYEQAFVKEGFQFAIAIEEKLLENPGLMKTPVVRNGKKATRLRLIPRTGRTHQLRVHCAQGLNCPILGDRLYGNPGADNEERLRLQARVLEFNHPVSGRQMRFELDPDF